MDPIDNRVKSYLQSKSETLEHYVQNFETSVLRPELRDLTFQCLIFLSDIGHDYAALYFINPTGTTRKLALKNIMLKMFEFQTLWHVQLQQKIVEIANSIELKNIDQELAKVNRTFRTVKKQVQAWRNVRNGLGGHYDESASEQYQLLKSIDENQVHDAHDALMSYCIAAVTIIDKHLSITDKSTGI